MDPNEIQIRNKVHSFMAKQLVTCFEVKMNLFKKEYNTFPPNPTDKLAEGVRRELPSYARSVKSR